MLITRKMLIGFSILIIALTAVVFILPRTTAFCANGCKEEASSKGTLTSVNGTQRQFSFNAEELLDGTARGTAVVTNAAFDNFTATIEIRCLEVVGNRARVAGIVTNTSDPFFEDNTAVFEVFDNPGKNNDTISEVFFSPPNSPPPTPAYCQAFENFEQMLNNGNVKVKDCPK